MRGRLYTHFSDAEIHKVLVRNDGNVVQSAKDLKVTRGALRFWLDKQRLKKAGIILSTPASIPDQSRLSEPDTKELRSLERQLASAKVDLKAEKAKRAQAEAELDSAAETLQTLTATANINPAVLNRTSNGQKHGSATAIICATDWHTEGKVDPANISGVNCFDLEIAQARIERLWKKSLYLLDFARNISDIKDVVLWLGGDLVNGAIHEELEETNFLGPAEAILFVQDQIAAGVDLLVRESGVEQITVLTNHGNHGRTTKRKRISTAHRHSWEWLAYQNLARYYKTSPIVSFRIAQGYHNIVRIQDRVIRFHHGDAIKYAGGVGGVTIPARKKIAAWNKQVRADLDIFGHFHQFLDMWDFVSCGCIVGYNEYAQEIGADFQPPTQTFIVVDKEYGKVMAVPIFVEPAREHYAS